MEYRVEELARAADLRVDTIRFYQTRGLLQPPRRVKRVAIYSDEHLATLGQIRRYQSQGLSLAVIKRLLAGRGRSKAEALLEAVVDESGEQSFTRAQLAARSGVPEALLASLETAGLLQPVMSSGEPLYSETEVQLARAGLEILGEGLPPDELLALALRHADGVEDVCGEAVDLFDRHVRTKEGGLDADRAADAFRRLLPAVTTLVALHFQRTLLQRATSRLRARQETGVLEAAAAVPAGRLEVKWR